MASVFEKDFDTILNDILTDYSNLSSQPDTSVGSTTWVIASVLASVIWGLYKYQNYISQQHFPDTADTDNLNHWGSIYDVTRDEDDSDSDYVIKILAFLRQPPAGGNAQDYETWAKDRENVFYVSGDSTYYNNFVTVQDVDGGVLGAVGIYTIPTDETSITTANKQNLRNDTQTYIDSVRPLGMLSATVYDSTEQHVIIDMDVSPETDGTVNTATVKQAIIDELDTFNPGQALHESTLLSTAINYGADSAVANTPSGDSTTPPNLYYFRTFDSSVTINYIV